MNINNSNKDFQLICSCDFGQHWAFSIFFKNLAICEQIMKLPQGARVIEVGSANSGLGFYTRNNLGRDDLHYIEVDINEEYSYRAYVLDITKAEEFSFEDVDLVIFSEVIEHLENKQAAHDALQNIYNSLKPGGIMVLTTPTPIPGYEELVWPGDHEYEYRFGEIYNLVNIFFEVEKVLPWSVKQRELQRLIEKDSLCQQIYCRLHGKMPDSFVRALIGLLAPNDYARQTLMVCKKRRVINA